ncbi:serine protease inhibitor 88Ea [Drosophila sechellia]|uniref:GM25800 n=1 Tax=Drosophila sechellia TaxID=7238 RepID=B4HE13_DROSE|nr:serine protease inhibitor 88Ea [Drosophila sechellia]EDW42105.1 GM25800 [Drosophila sechellia]
MHTFSLVLLALLPVVTLAVLDKPELSFLNEFLQIFKGERDFSLALMKQIREMYPSGNLFFSPFSTYNALLLAYFSSSEQTEHELAQALNLGWASSKQQVLVSYTLAKRQDEFRWRQSPMELSSANRIFVDRSINVSNKFNTLLYGTTKQLDFKNEPENGLRVINDWIADKTHNQIRDMLSSQEITSRTMLVLANAAYMKGQWLSQFKVEETALKPFFINEREQEMVHMMHKTGTFKMTIDEGVQSQIIKLPYRTIYKSKETHISTPETKSDISMIIILPYSNKISVNHVISRLNADSLKKWFERAMPQEIELSLPKFQFEQRLELTPILSGMGVNTMFSSNVTFGDLTADPISLAIDEVQHLAKIKVDEVGSTAAAATILFVSRSARQPDPTKFNCNHPFVFLIYDEKVDTILFAGVYSNPRQMQH